MSADPITVLTVTYGDRGSLIQQTALSVLAEEGAHLVVVSNGSSQHCLDVLRELQLAHEERMTLVTFERNEGSAPAFSAGLRAAYQRDSPILILDDDNPVAPGDLRRLSEIASLAPDSSRPLGIAIHRPINDAQRAILQGEPAERVFRELTPGAFHGFDLFSLMRRTRPQDTSSARLWGQGSREVVVYPLPIAMWGGLFLSREASRLGVLPLERLVLYCDDNDFSQALAARGCEIFLTDALSINDTEVWRPSTTQRSGWRKRLPSTVSTPEAQTWRLQYLFRNQAYLSRRQAAGNLPASLRLLVNAAIRMLLMSVLALIAGRPKLGWALTAASLSGLRARLGRSYPLPGGSTQR